MKKVILLIFLCNFFNPVNSQISENDNIIELPLEMVQGYVPFGPTNNILYLEDRWAGTPFEKFKVKVTGIPEDWENPVVQQISFDMVQQLYQNYKQGNIEEDFFKAITKQWNLNLEELELSEKPIKSFTHIVLTKIESGEVLYKVDTNNNRDFSDEEVFKPTMGANALSVTDSLSKHKAHWLDGEIFTNNEIKKVQFPFYVSKMPNGAIYASFPQYAKTQFSGKSILASSGFTDPIFRKKTELVVVDSIYYNKDAAVAEINEFIEIKGQKFQNLGVDYGKKILKLKKVADTINLSGTQVGYTAIPFSGNEFTTGDRINLNDYRGKFVLVEFWGTWCGPCIQEMPELKATYEKLDKDKIEFIGIAQDNPEPLREYIAKVGVPWPQILSDEQNNIVKLYGIHRFPSSFLINDKGKIVEKDIRSVNLLEVINRYISE